MIFPRLLWVGWLVLLAACATDGNREGKGQLPGKDRGAIAELKNVKIELKDEIIEDSLEKAMQSYQRVLELAPDITLTPQAMLRLADLKLQKEFGATERAGKNSAPARDGKIERPAVFDPSRNDPQHKSAKSIQPKPGAVGGGDRETDQAFEQRATASEEIASRIEAANFSMPDGSAIDLQVTGGREAIALYKKFLDTYPMYERRDQVLYQLSRSYEELGNVDESMKILDNLVKEFPNARYTDEFQLRRGEYYFTRKKFLEAEEAYKSIVDMGTGSSYYELALYKLGWSFYKQELYQDALDWFFVLMDYKFSIGYEFERAQGMPDEKRVEDTYRVLSLIFSNLGGADAVAEYFDKTGKRVYEVNVYGSLGEYYLDKRRYSDAALTYKAFVKRNPYSRRAPNFDMQAQEIYIKGGFPKLVIDSYMEFVGSYGLKSEYWNHVAMDSSPEVLVQVKTAMRELANHYHARYQDKRLVKDRGENAQNAVKWYRELLSSFPRDGDAPAINYQLAELLLEGKQYEQAAVEFGHTAYDYPPHEKAAVAGYALIYTQREGLGTIAPEERERALRDIIGNSWKFSDTFRHDEKAATVLGAAVDDIYGLKEYNFAIAAGRKLLANFPAADQAIRRAALLVIAHAMFELAQYADAEEIYQGVLQATPDHDPSRAGVSENLAASIYKQGEQAGKLADYNTAAAQFLRVAQLAPASGIRPAADYDAAAAFMQLKEWDRAAEILYAFRSAFPGHPLQPEASKKIAALYKETGKLSLAAVEYERIATESQDADVRKEALQLAADLHVQAKETGQALQIYRRYIEAFPSPIEPALETRYKISLILKDRNDMQGYLNELGQIVAIDGRAGDARTDRTRYLAATSAMVLVEPLFKKFSGIKLVQPFDQNLLMKSRAMKTAKEALENLLDYEVGDVTAAATFYLAEMYYGFSRALIESERPDDLSDEEKEQYELSIEEQAYPFEERAIQTHEKNLELMTLGIYNAWIENSIEKLAKLVPASYAKFEEGSGYIEAIDTDSYAILTGSGRSSARQPPTMDSRPLELSTQKPPASLSGSEQQSSQPQ